MLKSTYTPPPPLPPGWSEHRAPTGWFALSSSSSNWLTMNFQAMCTIITLLRSNRHIQDLKRKLLSLSRLPQHLRRAFHNTHPKHCRHFPRHRMDPRALDPDQDNLLNLNMVRVAAASEVEGAIKTGDDENPKTDQRKSTPYPAAHRGFW